MGQLTEDLRNLRAEINALKTARQAFRKDISDAIDGLKQEVNSSQRDFRIRHAEAAQRARQERTEFVIDIGRNVAKLKQQVAGDMKAFATELKSARQAWQG